MTELKFILIMILHKMCKDNLQPKCAEALTKLENKYVEEILNDQHN